MKLLFDHNLSHKRVARLADLFPGSTQTKLLGFGTATDAIIWEHAKTNGLVIITLDKDFADLAAWRGSPPENNLVAVRQCHNSRSGASVARQLWANSKI